MSEFVSQEIIAGYQYSLGQEAALAMNGLLTMTGKNYQQLQAGEGVPTEVKTAFTMFEQTAAQYLSPSPVNDTLMQTQKGTSLKEQAPKVLEIATEPLLESFLSNEQLEAQAHNQEEFDKTVHVLLEPVVNALLDKVPAEPQKRRPWQRKNESMTPKELTIVANTLHHSLTILAANDGSRLASARDCVKEFPFFTDDEAAFQVHLDGFGDDYPERFEVTWKNRHDNQMTRQAFQTYGQSLAVLLDTADHADGNNKLYRYMKRDAFGHVGAGSHPQTRNSIAFNLANRSFTIHSSNPTHADDNARRTYTFDAVRNVFTGRDGKNRQLPDITATQYFEVLHSLLNVFPLAELPASFR